MQLRLAHAVDARDDASPSGARFPQQLTTLPREGPRSSRALSIPTSIRGRGRILVVDDDPVQLRSATRVLQHFGYAVDAQSSGAAARPRLAMDPETNARRSYDLLILDMQLNEAEDGARLYRRIGRRARVEAAFAGAKVAPGNAAESPIRSAAAGTCLE